MEDDLVEEKSAREVEWIPDYEAELSNLQRSFQDVSNKFTQLEHAFRVNLQTHTELEVEVAFLKGKILRCRSKKRRMKCERDRWKSAFIQERNLLKRSMAERKSVIQRKEKCIKLLTGKTQMLDEKLAASRHERDETEARISKLANALTDALKNLDVRSQKLLQYVVNALMALLVQEDFMNGESAAELNLLATESKVNRQSENFLLEQNSVLREVIKDLKKKFLAATAKLEAQVKLDEKNNNYSHDSSEVEKKKRENMKLDKIGTKNCGIADEFNQLHVKIPEKKYHEQKNKRIFFNKNVQSKLIKSMTVEAIETHLNGVPYEEYIIGFQSGGTVMKFKYLPQPATNASLSVVKLVDTENDYQDSPLDATIIFISASCLILPCGRKTMGINCGTQTKNEKFITRSIQTTFSDYHGKILSSEKRALERNVSHLERTVNDLKSTAFEHAKNVIVRDSKHVPNDFFECLQLLEY